MQKKLIPFLGRLLGTGLLLGALTMPAMAASDIAVQVDDLPVQFTDAQPLIRKDRTYVPFRAIFEQMGALVTWNADAQTITAVRDGHTVQFQVGKTEVRITQGGSTQMVATDAAPFIEGNRTYVPVRFASQALGACVDWVQETRSVLIVDVAKLMDEYTDAFHVMDSYLAFTGGDAANAVSGSFALDLRYHAAMGQLPIKMTGTVTGSGNAAATELSGTARTDVAALRAAIEKNEGKPVVDSEIEALLTHLSTAPYAAILSRADGKVYLSSPLLTELGVQENGWTATAFSSIGGTLLHDLRTAARYDSFAAYAAVAAQQIPLKNVPEATVSAVRTFLEGMKTTYGDRAFQTAGTDKVLRDSAGTEILRLRHSTSGMVERAALTTATTAGARSYRTTIDQSIAAYVLSVTGKSESVSDFAFTLTLHTTPGGTAPIPRPVGDVTEINMP